MFEIWISGTGGRADAIVNTVTPFLARSSPPERLLFQVFSSVKYHKQFLTLVFVQGAKALVQRAPQVGPRNGR